MRLPGELNSGRERPDLPLVDDFVMAWAPVALAPFIGSFLGVVVERWPAGRPIAAGRSQCGSCHRRLGPLDLVPVASFLALRGRCRSCGAPIPWFHLWIELAALGVAVWAACAGMSGEWLWTSCILGWTLLALGWIDATSLRLPDILTLPLILGGLVEAGWLEPENLTERSLAAALGYTALWLLGMGYRRLRGREGIGRGDAKLLAAGGAWTGLAALPDIVLIGAAAGLIHAGGLWLAGRLVGAGARLPFGPFLAGGIWLAWLYLG